MLVVTHEIGRLAREVSDTSVFIDRGVVVEAGDPYEVIADPREMRTRRFWLASLSQPSALVHDGITGTKTVNTLLRKRRYS